MDYITIENTKLYFYGVDKNKAFYSTGYKERTAKLYYTPFKTWNQYLGNIPAGSYFLARLDNGKRKRVYINQFYR